MAKATMATAKAPAASLSPNMVRESIAPKTIADRRSTRAIIDRRNLSTIVGRRSVLSSAGRNGDSRMRVRRNATRARGCRTTVTSCPAKRKPPCRSLWAEMSRWNRRARNPPQGDNRVNARTFQARRKRVIPNPRR